MRWKCRQHRFTVVGYLDLWEIHPVFEHITGCHPRCAVYRLRLKLRKEHEEYRRTVEIADYEPLTIIAVFKGHLPDMRSGADLQSEDARCDRCGLPIPHGLAVAVNQKPYHPGCAGLVAKEMRDGSNAARTRGRKEDHAARPGGDSHARGD